MTTPIENIRQALAAATPGPWRFVTNGFDRMVVGGPVEFHDFLGAQYESGTFIVGGEPHEGAVDGDDPNIALIASSPTWLAELCDRVEADEARINNCFRALAAISAERDALTKRAESAETRLVSAESALRDVTEERERFAAQREEWRQTAIAHQGHAESAEAKLAEVERERDKWLRLANDAADAEVERTEERDAAIAERDARPALGTLPTEYVCGEWIMSGQAEPAAVVTYASEPSPETGHEGWCWWALGKIGEARDYMSAREAAEKSIRAHAKASGGEHG